MKHALATVPLLLTLVTASSALAQDDGPAPPAEWTCTPGFYAGSDGCDCGCGAPDPDCADASRASCAFNYCPTDQVPASNPSTCTANACGDGYMGGTEVCDDGGASGCAADCSAVDSGFACGRHAQGCHATVCGDGAIDGEDCDDGNSNSGDGCSSACAEEAGFHCGAAGSACTAVPVEWTCSANYYGSSDGCDCGCGVLDPDCEGGGCAEAGCDDNNVCGFCYDAAGTNVGCTAEGEGEGEPHEDGGEGEGEGEANSTGEGGQQLGGGHETPSPEPDEPTGCAATPVDSSVAIALTALAFALTRRRR